MPRKRKHTGIERVGPGLYRIRFGWTCPKTGKRKEVDRVVKAATVAEAEAEKARLRSECAVAPRSQSRERTGDFCVRWLRENAERLKHSTLMRHTRHLTMVSEGPLGLVWCDKLEASDIKAWLEELAEDYSGATLEGHLRVLRTVTRAMEREHKLEAWPCEGVRVPVRATRYTEEKPNGFSNLGELKAFLRAFEEHEPGWAPIVTVMLWTGARFSEVSALRWSDIDEVSGSIRILRSQVNGVVDTTKTDNIITLPLIPPVQQALREHRRRMLEKQAPGFESGWVFVNQEGGLLYSGCLTKPFKRVCKAMGLPYEVKPHGLRRTLNRWVKRIAGDEVARSILGHVTEEMTEHYSWVTVEEKRTALLHLHLQMETALGASESRSAGMAAGKATST